MARKKPPELSAYEQLQPMLNVVTVGVGIVIFCYNTFAQLSYVKEQQLQMQTLVDQRFKDAINHSDQNMKHTLTAIDGVKQLVQNIDNKMTLNRR
jgi:hypothetical protein